MGKYIIFCLFLTSCATQGNYTDIKLALDECIKEVHSNCEGLYNYASSLEKENARLRGLLPWGKAETESDDIADLWETDEIFDRAEAAEMGCDCDEEDDFIPVAHKQEVCPAHHRVMINESR
jgi:hypothetical protein